MQKIRSGDKVVVLTGKDRGKTGIVKQVLTKRSRVYVEGINLVKKHKKGNPNAGVEGGIKEQEAAIHVSNVALVDPTTQKPTRVGFKIINGEKVRYAKRSGEVIDVDK